MGSEAQNTREATTVLEKSYFSFNLKF